MSLSYLPNKENLSVASWRSHRHSSQGEVHFVTPWTPSNIARHVRAEYLHCYATKYVSTGHTEFAYSFGRLWVYAAWSSTGLPRCGGKVWMKSINLATPVLASPHAYSLRQRASGGHYITMARSLRRVHAPMCACQERVLMAWHRSIWPYMVL